MTSRTEALQDEYYRREGEKIGEFRYFHPDGSELTDAAELERIAKLAVPPGYTGVFVSPDPDAPLQAFGLSHFLVLRRGVVVGAGALFGALGATL